MLIKLIFLFVADKWEREFSMPRSQFDWIPLQQPSQQQQLQQKKKKSMRKTRGRKLINEYGCNICGKKFLTIHNLKSHQRRYCGVPRNIKCGHCNHRCKRVWDMKVHLAGVHGITKSNVLMNRDIINLSI